MNKKKKLIIIGVIALVLVIIGTTYAILTWTSSKINLGLTSACFTIDYTKGQDISGNLKLLNINESFNIDDKTFTIKEGMGLSYVNMGIKSTCTIGGYGSIYLNVTELSDTFKKGGDSEGALGYAILRNTSNLSNNELTIDNLKEQAFEIIGIQPIMETGTITLITEQLSNTELNKYLIVIFVDSIFAGNDITSATFNGNISADAEQGKMPEPVATAITNLYNNASKTTVTNNSINYEYDTTNSLMKDVGGNIRYYGASPNNYIYFNCSDYSNQSSSTCEVWRIIGVFDGKVKLIRNESIGAYSWDNKDTTTGAESNYGKNDWTDARLMKLLNPGYESETTGGSLYYNSKRGNCYSGQNNATTICNFTSTGIKNDITRNLISDTTYYLSGQNGVNVYPNEIYEKERGGTVYPGRPTTWTGKIALPYPSDYGYAADLGKCLNKQLGSYNDTTCTSNNWVKSIFTSSYNWLLTPGINSTSAVWRVYSSGYVGSTGVCVAYGVAPVLFLNSDANVKAGTGMSSNPYQLSVN